MESYLGTGAPELKIENAILAIESSINALNDRVSYLEKTMDKISKNNRLRIQSVPIGEVFEKDRYNVCNLWEGVPPNDYQQKLEETYTRNWIDLFHTRYSTITIRDPDLKWLQEAFKVGTITGTFPKTFVEELEGTSEKITGACLRNCFIRGEASSLKGNAVYGPGPFNNSREILEALCTCRCTHHPFSKEVEEKRELKLYVLPWLDNLKIGLEFRAFVYGKKLTALSPQYIYGANSAIRDDIEIGGAYKIMTVVKFLEKKVIPALKNHDTYTVDVALLEDESGDCEPYFIEINGFGAEYSAGSALFHWVRDKEILEGGGDKVAVRYVK